MIVALEMPRGLFEMKLYEQAFESLYVFFVLMLFGYFYTAFTGKDLATKEKETL